MKPVKPTAALPSQTLAALRATIGVRNTRKLCRAFGGSNLYIPKLEGFGRPHRNRLIRQDAARGVPLSQLALAYGLSERQVRRILSTRPARDFWSEPW